MAFPSSPGNTTATLPFQQGQQKSIAQRPTGSPENSMGSVEEINDTDVLLIQAFFSKASEVQDQAAQIEHEQASFSIEILSLECRIRALEEYYLASASTLGKRSRDSCQAITVDTQTEKRGQAIDCSSDQHHTHVATNSAHIPLSIPAAEFNPKDSSEALLPASPRRNYVHFLLESTLESPPKTNGQSMQIPQQDVITPPAHDVSTMIDVVPEPGASESLSSANVDLERVWAIDSANPSEAGSDPELELQYPSDADLELELELSRMAPNVSSSEPNICLGCKRTFSCQDALTRHLKSQGSSQGRQIAETESTEAISACLVATTSKKRKLEEALPMRNAWGTPPTASIADREIVLPPRPADAGAYTQPATPSIDNLQSLDVDFRATLFEEANGTWDATNHSEAGTHSHDSNLVPPNATEVPFRCPWCSKEHESSGDAISHIDLEHAWSALYFKSKRRRFRLLAKPADLFNIDVKKFSLPGAPEHQ